MEGQASRTNLEMFRQMIISLIPEEELGNIPTNNFEKGKKEEKNE